MRLAAFLSIPPEMINEFIQDFTSKLPGDKVKIIAPLHLLPEQFNKINGLIILEVDKINYAVKYLSQFESKEVKIRLSPAIEETTLVKELKKFEEAKAEAEEEWAKTRLRKMKPFGSTKRLEILPLVDWQLGIRGLRTETGVSYLIKTDSNKILFDTGLNEGDDDLSPLLYNMNEFGLGLSDFDSIIISHNHSDHTGGAKWSKDKTFSLTNKQIPLKGKKVYTPVPMTYPGLNPVHALKPTVIGEGVATTGTISSALFYGGLTPEQALAVNVEGKGIVLIVGCGHQGLARILKRADSLFKEPIYGIVGGLHYPVAGGPVSYLGMFPHKYSGTGKLPWDPVTEKELINNIMLLKERQLRLVALSPHDSSPRSLEAFKEAFKGSYSNIRVGEPIIISQ